MNYYTRAGFDDLRNRLSLLKNEGRLQVANALAEARDKGDLSENAEYDAAKDEQGILEAKIAKLETVLSEAIVLEEEDIDISRVSILSQVRVLDQQTDKQSVFMLVSQEEANLKLGKISISSPMGKGLLGKKCGEIAIVQTPAGQFGLKVLEIGLNLSSRS